MDQNEIARLRSQLAAVSSLLDEAEERLREGLAGDPRPRAPEAPPTAPLHGVEAPPVPPPPPRAEPPPDRRDVWADRLRDLTSGSRGLAVIGGTILILGLAFLYVLASQQGVLGPKGRTITGAAISFALIGAGIALQRRREQLVGAIAATGAGIAGLYLALVAATRIFDLIPTAQGLLLAGAVAVYAIVVARAWRSEWVALFGIIGALGAPVFLDAGITPGTMAFVLVLAAAAAWLWVASGWSLLATAAAALAGVYALALVIAAGVLDRDETGLGWNEFWQSVTGAGLFWTLLIAATLARHGVASATVRTVRLLVGSGGLAVGAAVAMFHVGDAGVPLLVVAGAYGLLAVGVWLRAAGEAMVAMALGLIAAAAVLLATTDLLDAGGRASVLAVQGGILALAATRLRARSLQIAAAVYLALAAVFTLVEAAPVRGLFSFPPEGLTDDSGTAMDGGATIGAIAAAVLLALGLVALAHGARRIDPSGERERETRLLDLAAAAAVLFAAATVIVDGALAVSFGRDTFQGAHAALSIVWGLAALAILVVGLRRRSAPARTAGLALLGVTLAKLVLYDRSQLAPFGRAVAFVVVGVVFVAGSVAYQHMAADDPDPDPEV